MYIYMYIYYTLLCILHTQSYIVISSLPNMEEQNQPILSRISTVVPATPRDEENDICHLSYMDMMMKLHYIKASYFFSSEAAQGLFSAHELKKPMFPLLDLYTKISGRIRRSECGRPFIKCNDAGVRIVESHYDISLQEWLRQNGYGVEGVVHDHVLGPDLGFSPLVFVKFTWFKCGGLCVGLSWSHILGDAFSAFNFMILWSKALSGHVPPKSLHVPNSIEPSASSNYPIYVKKVKIIGEQWVATSDTKVVTQSFYVTSTQLQHLVKVTNHENNNVSCFEILSALLWKYIANIRQDSESKVVTICTHENGRKENEFPSNNSLVLSIVEANVEVGKSDIQDLVRLIGEKKMVGNYHLREKLEEESGWKEDFLVYGANLTFVDLEHANIYGVKLNGEKPIVANCAFHGVGDKGVVLVLPTAQEDNEDQSNTRMITVSLPEKELDQLKDKLGEEWGITSYAAF
ncbi:hypothetical protein Lal_00030657 [Lupinus albus]|uniref:Putative quinate O-hydroxycinnamoyltransferase n=1 Tax=Lupinus albus TaxID=3870 RepID=A0A6A4P3C5_LUPAL|nr:putative quinate O-hydroxycinnamoyltransferase [Lupinus albus]KAF1863592.1 hypothetical protein Lal_00030657 [Lupinus albus]